MSELIRFERTAEVLREYAERVRDRYGKELQKNGHKATGDLLSSISTTIVVGEQVLAVDMSLAEHWKYVEYDTKPHWAPRDKILDWIKVKPVLPTPNENGKVPTPGQLAFLIQRKIANEGTKGSHDLENSVSALNEYYAQRIADAVAEDFGDSVDVVLKSFASF